MCVHAHVFVYVCLCLSVYVCVLTRALMVCVWKICEEELRKVNLSTTEKPQAQGSWAVLCYQSTESVLHFIIVISVGLNLSLILRKDGRF